MATTSHIDNLDATITDLQTNPLNAQIDRTQSEHDVRTAGKIWPKFQII
jgi:hypothetical protein